ncbi:hypothetical protein AMTRI_Chr03g140360 [Amborella trichopoda]
MARKTLSVTLVLVVLVVVLAYGAKALEGPALRMCYEKCLSKGGSTIHCMWSCFTSPEEVSPHLPIFPDFNITEVSATTKADFNITEAVATTKASAP